MNLAESRLWALQRKQEVVSASLDAWLAQTAGEHTRADAAFAIHYTQTREADNVMRGLREATAASLTKAIDNKDVVRRGATIETALLASCQVWEFYRSRLAQRLDPSLARFLRIADELAWQCYRPVRDFALGHSLLCKAPPLVYLNSSWSPFTVVRDREYEAEAVPRAFLRNVDFKTALSRLPFPIVAVPWYQTVYVPDGVSICHEIGHAVEADFGVGDAVAAAIAAAIPDPVRAAMWKVRGSELFADFYACLSVGPSYAWALANILIADPSSMAAATDPKYPSPYARLLFNAGVLQQLGFAAEAAAFTEAWEIAAATDTIDEAEVSEALALAPHFAGGAGQSDPPGIGVAPTSGKPVEPLRNVIGFTRPQQDEVDTEIDPVSHGQLASSSDIRVLFAVAAMIWRSADFAHQAKLLTVMRDACVDSRRNDQARLSRDVVDQREGYLVETGKAVAASWLDA